MILQDTSGQQQPPPPPPPTLPEPDQSFLPVKTHILSHTVTPSDNTGVRKSISNLIRTSKLSITITRNKSGGWRRLRTR